jgi:hypothetical protein
VVGLARSAWLPVSRKGLPEFGVFPAQPVEFGDVLAGCAGALAGVDFGLADPAA